MYRTEIIYFIVLSIIILLSPFLPNNILLLLDNLIIRFVIVLLLLYLISIGPTAGIFGLMTISILYLERNRRKIDIATKKLDIMDINQPQQATVEEESKPQKTVPVKPFDKPDETDTEFLPDNYCDFNSFEPVDSTINEKEVLATIYPLNKNESPSSSSVLYEKLGFGHIRGVETLGDSN